MKSFILATLISSAAFAQESDAPLATKTVEVCHSEADAILLAKYVKRIEGENESLKKDVDLPIWIPIVTAIVGAAIASGITATVVIATQPKTR